MFLNLIKTTWGGGYYLKQDKVDEEEKETRAAEPEKIIIWMNNQITFYHVSHLLDLQPHVCYNQLKLSSNQKYDLHLNFSNT